MSATKEIESNESTEDMRTFIQHSNAGSDTGSGRWSGFQTLSHMSEILSSVAPSQSPTPVRHSPIVLTKKALPPPIPERGELVKRNGNVKKRFIERSAVDDFEEFREAIYMFAVQKCPVSIQLAFCEDVRIFFEIMGPEHDRSGLKVIMESYSCPDSNKSQITGLLRFVISKLSNSRLMSEAVWLSGRICHEFVGNCSDDFELLSLIEYLMKRYCHDGGKASDLRYFKGKGKILKSNYKKSKRAFKKNVVKTLRSD